MSTFVEYLRSLFHEWWAIGGALSLIAFFIPRLNDYPFFIMAVAVIAFMIAGYRLHQQQINSRSEEINALGHRHAAMTAELNRQHESSHDRATARIARLESEIEELRRPKFTEETRQVGERAYRDLKPEHKIVLRYMFVAGDITDRQALQYLHTKGLATNWGSVFSHLSLETPFVQRVIQGTQAREFVRPYEGNYTLNPKFRDILEQLIEADPMAKA